MSKLIFPVGPVSRISATRHSTNYPFLNQPSSPQNKNNNDSNNNTFKDVLQSKYDTLESSSEALKLLKENKHEKNI